MNAYTAPSPRPHHWIVVSAAQCDGGIQAAVVREVYDWQAHPETLSDRVYVPSLWYVEDESEVAQRYGATVADCTPRTLADAIDVARRMEEEERLDREARGFSR